MADLNEIEATESVKIIGASPTGLETTPVNSTLSGGLYINLRNNAGTEIGTISNQLIVGGAGVAGTPAGGVLSVQGVSGGTALPVSQSGTWNINNISGTITLPTGAATETTLSALNTKHNADFGAGSGAIRVASLLGNASGAALFGAGTTTAQVLRVVLPTDQTSIPAAQSGTWNINNITGTVTLPTGAATETTLAAINTKTPALGQVVMASSSPVVIASNQTAIPITDNAGSLTVDGTVTANQGTPNTAANGWFTRITDGTNNASVTTNSYLQVVDISNNSGSNAAITVGTSALIANISGAANLTNRKFLSVHNNGTVTIYWGTSNAVTTSTGTPIAKGQFVSWAVGSGTSIYLISGTTSQNVRVVELA